MRQTLSIFLNTAIVYSNRYRSRVLIDFLSKRVSMEQFQKKKSRIPRAFISAVVIAALFATNAEAAVLANVEGAVSVNYGSGFQPAPPGSPLSPGDRVRTGNGSADIVYDNGCSVRLGPQQAVVVFSAPPPCNGGGLKDGVAVEPAGPSAPLILGGLVVVGGAVGLAVALSSSHKHPVGPPVSP